MGIVYDSTSAAVGDGAIGAFVAGARTPDFTLLKANAVPIRMYELVQVNRFTILKPASAQIGQLSTLLPHIDIWTFTKTSSGFEVVTPAGASLTTDFELGEHLSIVIRPDLYTGYVGADIRSYFEAFLV